MVPLKSRYFLIRITDRDGAPFRNLDRQTFWKTVEECVEKNFGVFGLGMIARSLYVKYYSPATGVGIIRVERTGKDIIFASLKKLESICGSECKLEILHVSGSMKSSQKRSIDINNKALDDAGNFDTNYKLSAMQSARREVERKSSEN